MVIHDKTCEIELYNKAGVKITSTLKGVINRILWLCG